MSAQRDRHVADFLARHANDKGFIFGVVPRDMADGCGLSRYQFGCAFQGLLAAGVVAVHVPPAGFRRGIWRVLASGKLAEAMILAHHAPPVAESDPEMAALERRERDRLACDRLLARLLRFHGDNPPDAEAAAAVARLRAQLEPGVA